MHILHNSLKHSFHWSQTVTLYFFVEALSSFTLPSTFIINLPLSVYRSLHALTVMRLKSIVMVCKYFYLQESLVYVRITIKSNKLKLNLRIFLALLDYVSTAHGIAICPSSVHRTHGFLLNFSCGFLWAIRSDVF